MKKIFWMTLLGLGGVVMLGCPIYSDDSRACHSCGDYVCNSDYDCPQGYYCNYANACVQGQPVPESGTRCTQPSDCNQGWSCGTDGQCHVGDCTNTGCPSGFVCKLSNGTVQCVGSGTPDAGPTDSGFSGCRSDQECVTSLGAGAKCLNGQCVKPSDQCFDQTQCPAGEQCVQGVCTPACDATHPCPTGYSCDANGTCSGNPTPCGTTTCPANTTCVEQHCVAPCGVGNTCPTGEVCVDGGCIPNQIPNFVCGTEGQAGDGKPGDCAVGSVCLHHNCYIACSVDAGADACKTADKFNVCKQVTTSGGTYSVCGSNSNLGGQCDPTKPCPSSSNVCIDGYCK